MLQSVMSKLEDWLQTEWPELKVYLTSSNRTIWNDKLKWT